MIYFVKRAPDSQAREFHRLSTDLCQTSLTEDLLRIPVTAEAPALSVPLALIRVPQPPESPKGHLRQPVWGHIDIGELTAALQIWEHTQCVEHVAVLPVRSFMEHGVSEIWGCWNVAAKQSQMLVQCSGYFGPVSHVISNLRSHLSSKVKPETSPFTTFSLSFLGMHTHISCIFLPTSVNKAVFQQADCDKIHWYVVWPSSHGSMLTRTMILIPYIIKAQLSVDYAHNYMTTLNRHASVHLFIAICSHYFTRFDSDRFLHEKKHFNYVQLTSICLTYE